jgi:mannose-1-phosphate guanylyltransferase
MIDHVVRSMPPEVDRVVLAVNYMADAIRAHLREADLGVEVVVVEEDEPLGTGGAFKNALGEVSEDVFIGLNGDIISSLDIGELLRGHRERGGVGTIALWEVEDPSRFGVVDLDPDGGILSFVEKPAPGEAPSNLINAGVYALDTGILDLVEPGRPTSIEREVFPKVIDRGLFGHRFSGFWVDAGTFPAYLEAHRELLDRVEARTPRSLDIHPTARVVQPCHLGEDIMISTGAVVGPYATLGDGCLVREGARIEDSVLLPRARVGANARLLHSVVGEGAEIPWDTELEGVSVEDGTSPQAPPGS